MDRPEQTAADSPAALEARLEELEEIATSLGEMPDEELSGALERAVTLLRELNAGIETRMKTAGSEAREAGELLEGIDLAAFDTAMRTLDPTEPAEPEAGKAERP